MKVLASTSLTIAALGFVTACRAMPKVTDDVSVCQTARTATRTTVCLNGYWHLQYGPDQPSDTAPAVEGGIIKVPGSASNSDFDFWDAGGAAVAADAEYKGRPRNKYLTVWYTRPFVIPKELDGKRLFVRFDGVPHDKNIFNNKVFVNGVALGKVTWLDNAIEITKAVKVGERNVLQVRLHTSNPKKGKAIYGSVWLDAIPAGPTIEGALALPKLDPKHLDVKVRVRNPGEGETRVFVRAYVTELDGKKRVLTIERGEVVIGAGEVGETVIGAGFPNAEFWDIDSPHLYRLWVELHRHPAESGASKLEITDQWSERFGFRTVELRGHEMFLNGKKFHGRFGINPGYANNVYSLNRNALRAVIREQRAKGFNGTQSWAEDFSRFREVCDEEGYLISKGAVARGRNESDEDYAARVRKYVFRLGNHPSIIIWWTGEFEAIYFHNVWPAILDEMYARQSAVPKLVRAEEIYKSIDPTRIPTHYGSGVAGNTFLSVLPYLPPGLPLQEHRDWPRQWHANGRKQPLYLAEFDLVSKWAYRNMDFQNIWQESTTDYVEHSARWLGEDAYAQIRKPLCDFRGADDKIDAGDLWAAHYADCWMNATSIVGKATFRAWRTYDAAVICPWVASGGWPECSIHPYEGLTASGVKKMGTDAYLTDFRDDPASLGVDDIFPDRVNREFLLNPVWEPWALKAPEKLPTVVYDMTARQHGPILVYVAGHPEFTAQDHTFFAGEEVTKQVAAINDTRDELPLKVTVQFFGLPSWAQWAPVFDETLSLKPGEIRLEPFTFKTPDVKERTRVELRLRARRGDKLVYEDTFAMTVFPKPDRPAVNAKIALYDKKGLTEAVLKDAGVTFTKVAAPEDLKGYDALIIGRESWDEDMSGPALAEALRGGLRILSFEQTPESVVGAHLKERCERMCFIQAQGHELLAGLGEGDFRDWRGSGDMIEAYPRITNFPRLYFPHWDNKGIVSTFPIMKGHFGNFRYLVASGYDMREAVLAEFFDGKGRLVLCQADVTNRYGTDPVATRLVHNLLAQIDAPPPALAPAVYIGGDDGKGLLDSLKISYEQLARPEAVEGRVIIVDGDALKTHGGALTHAADKGATIVALPFAARQPVIKAPWAPATEAGGVFRTLFTDKPAILSGLGASDFYLRNRTVSDGWKPGEMFEFNLLRPADKSRLIGDGGLLAEVPVGKGRFVFCQLDPRVLEGWQAYPKAVRVWSTLLTNLGVASSAHLSLEKTHTLDLAGTWFLKLDKEGQGLEKGWQKENLAGMVTASTVEKPAQNAVDGDLETEWKSSWKGVSLVDQGVPYPSWHPGTGQWLKIDFGETKQFDRIHLLLTTRYYIKHFAVQYATEEAPDAWQNIATEEENEKFEFDYRFEPIHARYVRFAATTCFSLENKGINCRPNVREIEVHDGDKRLTDVFRGRGAPMKAPYDDRTKSRPNDAWVKSVFSCQQEYKGYKGDAWWGRSFDLPESFRGRDIHLVVGSVNDDDWVYLNGKLVASTVGAPTPKQLWLYRPRDYRLPAEALKFGQSNTIIVRTRHLKNRFGGLLLEPMRLEARPVPLFPEVPPLTHYDPDKYYQW